MAETCPAVSSTVHQRLAFVVQATIIQNDNHMKPALKKAKGKKYWDHVTELVNQGGFVGNRREICRMAQEIQNYHLKDDCDCCCLGKSLGKVKLLPTPVVPNEQELNQWEENEDVQECVPIQQRKCASNLTVGGSSKQIQMYDESCDIETSEVDAQLSMNKKLREKLAPYHFTQELRSDLTKLIIKYGDYIIPEILGYTDDEMISFIKSSCTTKYYKKWYEQWSQR